MLRGTNLHYAKKRIMDNNSRRVCLFGGGGGQGDEYLDAVASDRPQTKGLVDLGS